MYATKEELEKAVGFQFQVIFANYEDGARDTELERILTESSGTIDELIRSRVVLPLTTESALLKRLCLAIAKYDVFSSMVRDQVPEAVRQDKTDAMKTLEKIQKGELLIDDGSEGATPIIVDPEFKSKSQVFSTEMD